MGPLIRTLAALFLCTTVATAATLALTAVWPHHLQMLAYPGLLLIAFLAMVIGRINPRAAKGRRGVCDRGSGGRPVRSYCGLSRPRGSISTWLGSGRSDTADLLVRAAEDRFPRLEETTFAHLGQNDEQAVAAFLDKEYVLACPTIAQYVYSPELSGVSRCIRIGSPSSFS